MEMLYRIVRSSIFPRVLVGALLAFFLYHSLGNHSAPPIPLQKPSVVQTAYAATWGDLTAVDHTERLLALADTDHIALLNWALENYQRHIRDYACTFLKQERINGNLKNPERINVRFRDEPFSVLMQWTQNPGRIDKLLYVEGQNDGNMVVHPTGLFAFIPSVKKDPRSEEARAASRNTCDNFGFRRTMQRFLAVYEEAQEKGDLQIACLGKTQVDGRTCVALERSLPPDAGYPYARVVIEIDAEYLVPTATACYDWRGRLLSRYEYRDLQFNAGLTPESFTPTANGL